jgi:hypothetical protein
MLIVMARGNAQSGGGAMGLQDHQKMPTIGTIKPRALHLILATHKINTESINAMEKGHAQCGAGVKKHLTEKNDPKTILSSIYFRLSFISLTSNK